ncbi:HNH endonuclease [Streptomyces gardneri]|uniref:HNH endonuclease n=1 Tax=Streptomyces gardneri TaxID=66892 RepID=UPI0035D68F00
MTQAERPAFINCARCGVQKKVGRSGPIPTYCSANCRAALKYQRSRQDGRYEQELAAARQRTREKQLAQARPCPYCNALMAHPKRVQCGAGVCKRRYYAERMRDWQRALRDETGEWYHRKYADAQREYSRLRRQQDGHWRKRYPAAAAAGDARRRMRMKQARTAEVFAPLDVHTRDQWTCQLCLLPIAPEVAWPDPMSPSVDHVIPLVHGGQHSMINVQSAHLGCNSRKRDRVAGEARSLAQSIKL